MGCKQEGKMSLNYNKKFIPRAKELRRRMTRQEKHLWYDFLSTYHVRFQRQKTIGNFIVDFYCHKAKLVVEVDGSQHYTKSGMAYDQKRTAILNGFGLQVIRFRNAEVDKKFWSVCHKIHEAVELASPPVDCATSPSKRETGTGSDM